MISGQLKKVMKDLVHKIIGQKKTHLFLILYYPCISGLFQKLMSLFKYIITSPIIRNFLMRIISKGHSIGFKILFRKTITNHKNTPTFRGYRLLVQKIYGTPMEPIKTPTLMVCFLTQGMLRLWEEVALT